MEGDGIKVAAIILAAGASNRFGRPKQLLPWGKKTVLQHIIDVVLSSPVEQTIVVLGYRAEELQSNVKDARVETVVNESWNEGMSSSVRAGLSAVRPEVEAALFVLADQPTLTSETIAQIVRRYGETLSPIVVPTYKGKRGNPVLFARSLFAELSAQEGDVGGRLLIARYEDEVEEVEVRTDAVLVDIDTMEDYLKMRLKSIKSLIIDLDGVIYRGEEPIPGAREFIALLRREGVPFLLLTNNSTRSPAQYMDKLARMGIEVEEEDIFTSAQATALYLEKEAPEGAKAFVIGEQGLLIALKEKCYNPPKQQPYI